MDQEPSEVNKYDWSQLKPSTPDGFQKYVLLAHILLGIIISVLSFSDGWPSWGIGTGAMTPVLLAVAGGIYTIHIGINWYRTEFIPYITRIQSIPEFESDRFLKYQRVERALLLMSGYFALLVSQYVWTQIATFVAPLMTDMSRKFELLTMFFFGIIILDVVLLLIVFGILMVLLRFVFSDIGHILDLDDGLQKYYQQKRKEEKEAKEQEKKAKKNMKKGEDRPSESKDDPSTPVEEME